MNGSLFTVLFAVYPVLFIAVSNPGQTASSTVGAALAASIIAAGLLLATMRVLFATWARAALAVAIIELLFYAYGPAHTLLEGVFLDSIDQTAGFALYLRPLSPYLHSMMTTAWAVTGFFVLRRLRRMPETPIQHGMRFCNAMSIALVAMVAVQWVIQGDAAAASKTELRDESTDGRTVSVLGYNPDIYTIVLDGYAREDVLRDHYKFDNSAFLDGLRSRGFRVSSASTANYNWTFLSLASLLNMDYLQPLMGNRIAPAARDRAAVYDAVRNNAVARFLKDRGYRIVHFQTTWGATLRNPYADEQVACHQGVFTDEFFRVLAEASWLKALQPRMSTDLAKCHLSHFESLADMGGEAGPKFVFAHFLPPHHPYLFDRQGNILRTANLSNQFEFQRRLWEEKAPYVDQLAFMNRRITDAVDRILKASPRPPIIIIQSDHGPNLDDGLARDEKVRVRLANLAAYLLPQAPEQLMPPDVSAVNQFRHIFNHYFNERAEILPSRQYFSEYDRPYTFTDVTLSRDASE